MRLDWVSDLSVSAGWSVLSPGQTSSPHWQGEGNISATPITQHRHSNTNSGNYFIQIYLERFSICSAKNCLGRSSWVFLFPDLGSWYDNVIYQMLPVESSEFWFLCWIKIKTIMIRSFFSRKFQSDLNLHFHRKKPGKEEPWNLKSRQSMCALWAISRWSNIYCYFLFRK